MDKIPAVVVYHHGCIDGIASAWAAHQFFKASSIYQAEYFPGRYQELPNIDYFKDKIVICADFSYPLEYTESILQVCTQLIMLDHHKTCFEMLKALGTHKKLFDYCEENLSGCLITWQYFFNTEPPLLLNHISDRDLWQFNLPNTKDIMAGVFSYDFSTIEKFQEIIDIDINILCQEGIALNRAQTNRIAKIAYKACELIDKYGNRYWSVNSTTDMSELGEYLCNRKFSDGSYPSYASIWYVDESKDIVQYSLRSVKDRTNFDVSTIAKANGGGGHRNAAGYRIFRALGIGYLG